MEASGSDFPPNDNVNNGVSVTRMELFTHLRGNNFMNSRQSECVEHLSEYIFNMFRDKEDVILKNSLKLKLKSFVTNLFVKYTQCKRLANKLLVKHKSWIEQLLSIPLKETSDRFTESNHTKQGRPRKTFQRSSIKSKRRVVSSLVFQKQLRISIMNQPKEYAKSNIIQVRDLEHLVEEFREEFKRMKGRIIDIGCGPGNTTKQIILPNVDKDAVIVGADISPEMVRFAQQQFAVKDKLSFLQLDIQTPQLPESLIGQFDNIVSIHCFNWCRNMKLTLENCYQLLRPGGKAFILTISHHKLYDIYPEQRKNPRFSAYMQDYIDFTSVHHGHTDPENMLRKDLHEVGFKIQHCTNRSKTYTYPSLNALVDLMISVNPFVNRMPEDLQEEYKKDLKNYFKEDHQAIKANDNADGSLDFTASLLIALFEKP